MVRLSRGEITLESQKRNLMADKEISVKTLIALILDLLFCFAILVSEGAYNSVIGSVAVQIS